MRNSLLFAKAFALFLCYGQAQAQCPDNLPLHNQSQVADFIANYPNCTELPGDLTVYGANVTDITPLSNLTSIGGKLFITNSVLTSLAAFENLTTVGGDLTITSNYELTSLEALQNLTTIGGQLYIRSNTALPSLSGLDSVISVGESVNIEQNTLLTSLSGLESLTSVGGYLRVANSNALTSLSGLDNVATVGGTFTVTSNQQLTSLSGLDNLTYALAINIYGNAQLSSIEALESMTATGWINISNNDQLTSLSGLENLTAIDGNIKIALNDVLTDIADLQNIDPETIVGEWGGIEITNNPALSVCNLPNFCIYLQGSEARTIEGNAGDCVSEETVTTVCALGIATNDLSTVQLYPNPIEDRLYFDREIYKLTLTDLSGKVLVSEKMVSQTDMSAFQSGVYLLTLQQENGSRTTRKVIKR